MSKDKGEVRPARDGVHFRMNVLMPCKSLGVVNLLRATADNLTRLNETCRPPSNLKEATIQREREEISQLLLQSAMAIINKTKVLWEEYHANCQQTNTPIDTSEEEWSERAEERHEED